MGKSFLGGVHGRTLVSGEGYVVGASFNSTTEAQSQASCTEGASFTALRGAIASGGSGTNTFQFRDAGANGQNVASRVGVGTFEDTTNTDTLTAGDLFNVAYTDTGTESIVLPCGITVEFASGHGAFHFASGAANLVMDAASSTRYLPINGIVNSDGTTPASIANVQFRVREYTSLEAFQIRINANARTNNSVFSVNVNGSDVGTAITFAAAATGLQSVTGMGIALSPGDLVCISITLGTGVEDLNFGFLGVTMKSTANGSRLGFGTAVGSIRAASATPNYYSLGQGVTTTETNAAIKPGFAARLKELECFLRVNTYTVDATLRLMVNGVATLTTTITALGGSGWYSNLVDTVDIDADDVVSFEIVGGTSGSITIHQILVSAAEIPPAGPALGANPLALLGVGRLPA